MKPAAAVDPDVVDVDTVERRPVGNVTVKMEIAKVVHRICCTSKGKII